MPTLNVAPYIGICMESVINQTLLDIEIIVVDDGSIDVEKQYFHKLIIQKRRLGALID